MAHDFAAQRAETQRVFAQLDADNLPEIADIDYFFVPVTPGADWTPLAEALDEDGYDCAWIEDAEGPYLCATLPDQMVTSAGIWIGEEVATRLALPHGFRPDGWGFEG